MKALIAAALILAQTTATAPYIETLEVRIHNLDVIVTDRDGKPVTGLTRDDFEVLQEGVPQEITNFAVETLVSPANGGTATPTTGGADVAETASEPRRVVVFVDDVGMHPRIRGDFEREILELVEQTLRPEDEAMVFRPNASQKVAIGFTTDRAALRGTLRAVLKESRRRADSPYALEQLRHGVRMQSVSGSVGRRHIQRLAATEMRQRVEQRLGNLRTIVTALSEMPGRKVVILVSESLPAAPGRELFGLADDYDVANAGNDSPNDYSEIDVVDLKPMIREIARTAGESGTTIYSLQPELGLTPPGDVTTRRGNQRAPLATNIRTLANTEDTLATLAKMTGGRYYRGDRATEALDQVAADLSAYYSLGIRAADVVDQPQRIEVRVKNRPELNVRTRSEVLRRSPRTEMNDRVVASLLVPRDVNELGIRATAGKPKRVAGETAIYTADLLIEVPLSKLTFIPSGDRYRGSFTIHYAATGDAVDFKSGMQAEQVVEIPAASYEAALHKSWKYTAKLQMRKGALRVGVGVMDAVSHQSGFQTLELDAR